MRSDTLGTVNAPRLARATTAASAEADGASTSIIAGREWWPRCPGGDSTIVILMFCSSVTLSEFRGSHFNLTPSSCAASCGGFEYFGVENGNECWCGQTIDGSRGVGVAECSTPCTGDDLVLCGAGWRLTAYRRVAAEIELVPGWEYVSCFSDATARTLPEGPKHDNMMTAALCAGLCDGFDYFGVENRNECFCGNGLDMSKKVLRRDPLQCESTCAGDARYVCGNAWRLTAYREKPDP